MERLALMPKYDDYVDSGVEWLGRVPASWELTRLGTRFNERRSKVSDIDYPALSVTKKGVLPQLDNAAKTKDGDNRKLVKEGDFVINSRSDRKGSSGVSDRDGSVSLINIVLKPKGIHPKFSEHLLKSHAFIEEYYRVGRGIVADLWTTRYDEMRTITISVPSLEEQTRIANFLDKKTAQIDDAIAIKEQQINLLKERKQIIIQQAVTQGLDPNVPMKDSGVDWIGEIPEHWEIKPLKHILKLKNLKIEAGKSNLEYLGMECVNSFDGTKNEIKSEADGLSTFFQVGDILFGKLRPYLAKVYVADFEGVCSTEFLVYEVKRGSNAFFSKLMLSNGFISVVDASTYGSKMPRASSDFIGNLNIVNPPFEEQIKISSFIDKQNELFDMNISLQKAQIEKLKEYKTTLINSAVTGKIKITPEMVEQ
ncbi:Type I restriction-modification system, specificity subunit S [Alteromonas macleodii]|jgi:type I restriction enzyme S subunit|uniref:Restriction endonuclease subunit S n=2 Tax=Alteromonas TaxID=226 RepID=A0AAC8XIA8_9ALTE|nr:MULTISPECIES: restriction endonuclease subunit S [Alteromonas]MEC8967263.1 restriction endonuclease subunit S [Pseudomonadota bacterium]AFV84684.1 type I DNA specificity S subunit [Alteromonas mediterranea DE1]AGP96693.1 type I DNA specificity S subunit [Alteromonas mediterranea UM7]AGQ01029.1 type I DNA specificity S subunit [Alteromonas mediterranea UM4b]AMJ77855.1 restriction endonuclease subunit S [Alteromonas mediterranea]|tara:strand:+ start:1736 stop:3004 length:1269 start_codon:yes stop_codon:yes gene_type:complete